MFCKEGFFISPQKRAFSGLYKVLPTNTLLKMLTEKQLRKKSLHFLLDSSVGFDPLWHVDDNEMV